MRTTILRPKLFVFFLLIFILLFSAGQVSSQMNFNLILHDVVVEPVIGQYANQIKAYVSVLDESGLPVRDLSADIFSLVEDSQPVEFSIEAVRESQINMVMVVDTSGSMAGTGIEKARQAVQLFVERLSPEDRIALISFSNEVTVLSDFTGDKASFNRQVAMLEAVPNGGTCLYDAVYKAVQLSSVLPQGRRAVMILTDGRDELANGSVCSSAKLDDAIHLATNTIGTPVYSIGVGKEIDENGLQRLALLTGGSFLKSTDFTKLDSIFEIMQAQLKEQYVLSYVSKSPVGDHTITVQATIGNKKDEDTRLVRIAEPPPVISISAPETGSIIDKDTKVTLSISGQQSAIAVVQYELDGKLIGENSSAPFGMELKLDDLPESTRQLTVKAYDSEKSILSEDSIAVIVQQPVLPTLIPTIESEPPVIEPNDPVSTQQNSSRGLLIAGIALALIGVLAVVFFVLKPFERKNLKVEEGLAGEVTFDSALGPTGFGNSTLAVLTVIHSDEPSRISERIPVMQAVVHIGRSATNEVVFAKDHPVSRHHAVIELKNGQFQISEALTGDESGMKEPTFGTFVNEEKLYGAPMSIRSGDEIRLGTRLRLRFEAVNQPEAFSNNPESLTMDGIV